MIKAIISGIFKLIMSLVTLLLSPIDSLIASYLPGLDNGLTLIANFFNFIGDIVPWVISYTGINTTILSIYIDIMVFILTVPFMINAIKTALAWYDKLKL